MQILFIIYFFYKIYLFCLQFTIVNNEQSGQLPNKSSRYLIFTVIFLINFTQYKILDIYQILDVFVCTLHLLLNKTALTSRYKLQNDLTTLLPLHIMVHCQLPQPCYALCNFKQINSPHCVTVTTVQQQSIMFCWSRDHNISAW